MSAAPSPEPRSPEGGPHHESAVVRASRAALHSVEIAFSFPEPSPSRWKRAGMTPRAQRVFNVVSGLLLLVFAAGWTWSIAIARTSSEEPSEALSPATAAITAGLSNPDAPSVAYLTQAALDELVPLRGESGKLRVTIRPEGAPVVAESLPSGTTLRYSSRAGVDTTAGTAPAASGIWSLAVQVGNVLQPLSDFRVITLHPLSEKRRGRIGLYYLGNWPTEGAKHPRPGYAPPAGFIEVTPQNEDTYVSEHFRLRDFLTHDQPNVWPKYMALSTKLVDKLELVLADLQARGIDPSGVVIMSGFRTPRYNRTGGDPSGRAALSRHMYGDAADIFIDDDHNGEMDDLNHDGRVNIADSRVILAAVDRVDRAHPELVGGAGVYPAESGHGPFIHIDTRGFRARWIGTGGD